MQQTNNQTVTFLMTKFFQWGGERAWAFQEMKLFWQIAKDRDKVEKEQAIH